MSFSIKQNFKFAGTQEEIELKAFANTLLTDLAALRASVVGITAQLDADAGVTDTDYAANNDPASLSLIS